jgi:hypothetical protein
LFLFSYTHDCFGLVMVSPNALDFPFMLAFFVFFYCLI